MAHQWVYSKKFNIRPFDVQMVSVWKLSYCNYNNYKNIFILYYINIIGHKNVLQVCIRPLGFVINMLPPPKEFVVTGHV